MDQSGLVPVGLNPRRPRLLAIDVYLDTHPDHGREFRLGISRDTTSRSAPFGETSSHFGPTFVGFVGAPGLETRPRDAETAAQGDRCVVTHSLADWKNEH